MRERVAKNDLFLLVPPAQAGVHSGMWIRAFAGMTEGTVRDDREETGAAEEGVLRRTEWKYFDRLNT